MRRTGNLKRCAPSSLRRSSPSTMRPPRKPESLACSLQDRFIQAASSRTSTSRLRWRLAFAAKLEVERALRRSWRYMITRVPSKSVQLAHLSSVQAALNMFKLEGRPTASKAILLITDGDVQDALHVQSIIAARAELKAKLIV